MKVKSVEIFGISPEALDELVQNGWRDIVEHGISYAQAGIEDGKPFIRHVPISSMIKVKHVEKKRNYRHKD